MKMKKIFISTLIITPLLSAFGWFAYDSYQKRAEEAVNEDAIRYAKLQRK